MRFEVNAEERYTAVKLLEEKLDSRISPDLKAEFVNLSTKGVKNLILDLEDVKYVDSSGLSAILTANRLCQNMSGVMVMCHINPHVDKLIKISQLEGVLTLLPTKEEAREMIFMREIANEIEGSEE
ncbi:MAG: STAS domain-containing protein [Bacteroidota bacterium]